MARATVLAAPGTVVDIVTTDHGLTDSWRALVTDRLPASTTLHVHPESRWLGPGGSFELLRWLWNALPAYNVLHIHALFGTTSSVAAAIARTRGVPYVVRPLGTLSPYTFSNRRRILKRLYFAMIDRRTLRGARAIHFTAPQEASKASRLDLPSRSVVIPISQEPGLPRSEQSSARSLDVLFMSRLHPVKGLDLLLPAFARAAASHPSARLLIAGDGPSSYVSELKSQARSLGIEDRVQWLGYVEAEQKRDLLQQAALFVQPSYQENFGVAVVEALAVGTPVLITREVDIWPDVERFASGLAVAATVDSLAQALQQLLGDEAMRERFSEGGIRQVRELYAPAVVGEALMRLYGGIVDTRHASATPFSSPPGISAQALMRSS
jgi:glycosyltransferase involved in cell wall biosynthesis